MKVTFSLSLVAKTNGHDGNALHKSKVPQACDLLETLEPCRNHPVEPSAEVVAKLGSQNLANGIDIETTEWTHQKHGLQKG